MINFKDDKKIEAKFSYRARGEIDSDSNNTQVKPPTPPPPDLPKKPIGISLYPLDSRSNENS